MSTPSVSKADLRRAMRAHLRAAITTGSRAEKSLAICHAIARHPAYLQSRTVLTFDPMPAEPDVSQLWELAPRRFIYPRIHGSELLLFEVPDHTALLANETFASFREPAHAEDRLVAPTEIDLVLVPGLAFTRDGQRLGRGGGFYDRLLACFPKSTPKLGVCFALQIVEHLPTEPHDWRVDAVLTEAP